MKWLTALLAILTLAGCATQGPRSFALDGSASPRFPEALAGHWTGMVWETSPWYIQGKKRLDLQIDDAGAWRGTIGSDTASGVLDYRGGRVVVTGTSRDSHGGAHPVFYRLIGNRHELWGQTVGTFSERSDRASVSLERQS